MEKTGILEYGSPQENAAHIRIKHMFDKNPIPSDQVLSNLGIFIDSKTLSRLLFLDFIYKKIINIQGVVFDFGTRWGQNLVTFQNLRSIYEPYNRHRLIVGFDTFEGFPEITQEDGNSKLMEKNNLSTTKNYENYLSLLLSFHQILNPLSHISKNNIIKGDASFTLIKYLIDNPETIIALAYFDFDIYQPTKDCLEIIKNRLTKGSILVFDELNDHDSPGETIALMEIFGLNNINLQRYQYTSRTSYFRYGE